MSTLSTLVGAQLRDVKGNTEAIHMNLQICINRLGLGILLIFQFLAPLAAQTLVLADTKIGSEDTELRLRTFEKVWRTVNERHFDPTFGGVDWKRVYEIYEPRIRAAKTEEDFYNLLQEMLGELGQSHFAVIPPNVEIAPNVYGEGEIGIDLQILDKEVVITRVDENSSGFKNGLKPGFVIKRINGKTAAEILTLLDAKLEKRKIRETVRKIYRQRSLLAAISGKIGSIVNLEVVDAGDKARSLAIERLAFIGEMSAPIGNFSAQKVIFESKRLPSDIGYLRFNIWVMPQMAKLRAAIAEFSGLKGIIIDLRGNPGGIGQMTTGLAGLLVKEQTTLGTNKDRISENELLVYPQENAFYGKVVILTDGGTGSASEVFTAGLQGIGRAKVVGERSAGAVLPSTIEKLPTGASFLFAIAEYRTPAKILIEGRGIEPDLPMSLTRKSLLENVDLQLQTAIKEIQKKK